MTAAFFPQAGMDAPAVAARAVTPSDTLDLGPVRALYIGTAGSVSVLMAKSDTPIVFAGINAGQILPISVDRVRATGTSASNIVALY